MKPKILALLILAATCLISSEVRADEPVRIGQPTIFWRNGEWQTYKNGVWTPYGKTSTAEQSPRGQIIVVGGVGHTTIGIGQPNGQVGKTTVGIGQPQGQLGQTTIGIGQRNGQIGQTTIGIGQRNGQIGQPTIGIGQPNGQPGQTTIGIGQPNGRIGQSTVSIGQPNGGIGQTTIGIGQQSGTASPHRQTERPPESLPENERGARPHPRR